MPLLHIHDLVSQTWQDYKKHWNAALHVSAWYLVGPIIYFILALFARVVPSVTDMAKTLGTAVMFVFIFWTTIRLMLWLLRVEQQKLQPADNVRLGAALLLPFFWVTMLSNLATLGGTVLFVLPGIWLLVAFKFWPYVLLDRGTRGIQTLAASAALVKGRWWAVMWRLLIPQLLFVIVAAAFVGILMSLIAVIAGSAKMELLLNNGMQINPLVFGLRLLIEGLAQMVFMPLFILVEVKLYQNLRDTRTS